MMIGDDEHKVLQVLANGKPLDVAHKIPEINIKAILQLLFLKNLIDKLKDTAQYILNNTGARYLAKVQVSKKYTH